MKKLKLGASVFQKEEALTRTQLKKVLGGSGSEDPNGKCLVYCRDSSGNQLQGDKKVSSCDEPVGVTMDSVCLGIEGYVKERTTCTC
ncbi:hypothetical protein SAMN05421820_102787 [Pedobacter steynii]|uniref:Uncharacterized protein n=1 Tax=Pedobacter steynii TaxID=430522 RepID=A0A1G9PW97_9SPHI|nr:hypothetical protein [Pedobacter steynii]NQX38853.1 hypothetical protein [Pedobacter steynii]SDM03024.1 hypothetical protein SAMN05421820_102787 [Pedobacter steynii]